MKTLASEMHGWKWVNWLRPRNRCALLFKWDVLLAFSKIQCMYAGSRKQGDFFKVMSVMAIGDETLYDGWTGEHVD